MLPRGRPRALGAAALLLLLLLIGFLLFGGDLECERRERGGPGSFPCALTPRIPQDGRPREAAALDRDPQTDHGGHNRSDCVLLRPLPSKCEVGVRGPWWRETGRRRVFSPDTWAPVRITPPGVVTRQLGAPRVHTSPYQSPFPCL